MSIILNLTAFILPIILFLYWGVIGYGVLSLLRTQRNLLQNILLAPTVGIAVTLLPVFWLNRAGIPVSHFAAWLSGSLLVMGISTLLWRKPPFPWRHYLPFAAIFLFSLFLTGRPLLEFGFNWLSYGNDDMANYCLRAARFLHHGYQDIPNVDDLVKGRDYSLFYWFWDVPGVIRAGTDLLLSWVSATFQLSPLQAFMPFIIALLLSFISATGAIIYQSRYWHSITLTTCFLLACSPLTSLGALYQLLGQVAGLALLCGAGTLLLQPFTQHLPHGILRQSILISIIMSALLICYPECLPFITLAVIAYFGISLAQHWRPQRNFWGTLTLTILFLIILLNKYWINVISFIGIQLFYGFSQDYSSVFPYFLHPSGMALLWGFQIISIALAEPWHFLAIFTGFCLFALTIITSLTLLRKKTPIAIIFFIMLCLGSLLLYRKNGFALFKLSMYIQPFLICIFVIAINKFFKRHYLKILAISLFAIISLHQQYSYVRYSEGAPGSPFVELPNASKTHLVNDLLQLNKKVETASHIVVDAHSIVPAKLLALNLIDKETTFYSNSFFKIPDRKFMESYAGKLSEFLKNPIANFYDNAADATKYMDSRELNNSNFALHSPQHPNLHNSFVKPLILNPSDTMLVVASPLRTIFNRRKFFGLNYLSYSAIPWREANNYLIFLNSTLGQDYYYNPHISIYNLENDYFYKNNSMARIGQYLLFRVVNPSSKVRLELNITSTLNHDGDKLPLAAIVGKKRQNLSIMGRGSAHIFSPTIDPQIIDHIPYLMIDMGNLNKSLTHPTSENLVAGYARNISLISENEYHKLVPPTQLSHFPADLTNMDLEYSGIYEDGWISEDAFFTLSQPDEKAKLLIKGSRPNIDNLNSSLLTIMVNSKKILVKEITQGDFEIFIPIAYNKKRQKIELHFSRAQTLPKQDDRIIAAKMEFIGFVHSLNELKKINPPANLNHFPHDFAQNDLESKGIYSDGWISKNIFLTLSQPTDNPKFIIKGMLPKIDKNFVSSDLTVSIDGKEIANKKVIPGNFELQIPMSYNGQPRKVELHFSKTQKLPYPDTRNIAAKIDFIGFSENKNRIVSLKKHLMIAAKKILNKLHYAQG